MSNIPPIPQFPNPNIPPPPPPYGNPNIPSNPYSGPNSITVPEKRYSIESSMTPGTHIDFEIFDVGGSTLDMSDVEFKVEAQDGAIEYIKTPKVKDANGKVTQKEEVDLSKGYRLSFNLIELEGVKGVELPKIKIPDIATSEIQPRESNNGAVRHAKLDLQQVMESCDATTRLTIHALLLRDAYFTALCDYLYAQNGDKSTLDNFDDQDFIDMRNSLLEEGRGGKVKKSGPLPKFYTFGAIRENWRATRKEVHQASVRNAVLTTFDPKRIKEFIKAN